MMTSIVFNSIPVDIKARHDANRTESLINGGYVFYMTAVQAILRHSRCDRFLFLSQRALSQFSLAHGADFAQRARDIRCIHPSELAQLHGVDDPVILTSTERLGPLLRLRELLPSQPPAIGFLCATHPKWFGPLLVEMALAGVTDCDALVCSSRASRTVVHSLLGLLNASDQESSSLPCRVQTPLIPMGIDCDQFVSNRDAARRTLGFADDDVVILYFGRFEAFGKCDLGPLMLTFSRLKRGTPRRLRLVLAGADRTNAAAQIAQFAAQIDGSDGIDVHRNVTNEEKLRLLSAADIFVSPGDGIPESFGLAPVEAMASGLPCVVSDWNGYRETVTHGETGFLVPTTWADLGPCADAFDTCGIDSIATLAATTVLDVDALERYLGLLVDDADLRRCMGRRARERALSHFDWPVIVRQYDDMFDVLRSRAHQIGPAAEARRDVARRSRTQALFNHYPTEVLTAESLIVLGDMGRRWLRSPLALGVGLGQFELLSEPLCVRIAELLARDAAASPLGTVVQRASDATGEPPWLVRLHVMRLMKYGVLGRVESQAASLPRLGRTSEYGGRAARV